MAPAADGGFVVVWQNSAGDNIFGRYFDDQGNGGNQGQVNLYSENSQEFPAIASDAEGNFVVVYESFKFPADGDGDAIVGQRFSSRGEPPGPRVPGQHGPGRRPAGPRGGKTARRQLPRRLGERRHQQHGDLRPGLRRQRDDVGDQFLVNGIQENNQEFAAVGAWSGGYVVAWESFPDGEGRGIFARRFDSVGIPLGDQFLVNTDPGQGSEVRVGLRLRRRRVRDRLGGRRPRRRRSGVRCRRISPSRSESQFLVSPSDAFQREPRVAVQEGGFLITWFGGGAEIDDDILGRNYVVPEPGATALGLAALSTLAGLVWLRAPRS